MAKTLTIVIPTYNVEQYIGQCLDSFLIPDLLDKLEILVIDDGSPDSSAHIARTYADKYPSAFFVISKENGGHGSTINTGIKMASGKYFKVVDGDDWVSEEALRNLVSFLDDNTCDIVYTNYCWVYESNGKRKLDQEIPFHGVHYGKIYPFDEVAGRTFIKMHNMTVRTEILKAHCRSIQEHSFYVDNEYILYPIPFIRDIAFLDDILYMYRIGRAEQSVNITKMQERCGQHEKVLSNLLDFYENLDCSVSSSAKAYVAKGIARMFCSQVKIYLSYKPNQHYKKKLIALDQYLKDKFPEIYGSARNAAVKLLRLSGYRLYYPGALLLRAVNRL